VDWAEGLGRILVNVGLAAAWGWAVLNGLNLPGIEVPPPSSPVLLRGLEEDETANRACRSGPGRSRNL